MRYRCYFAVYRHEEQRMRRSIWSKPGDLFAAPPTEPLSLPGVTRVELVSLLSALLWEVISHQRFQTRSAQQEPCHEQQDHA